MTPLEKLARAIERHTAKAGGVWWLFTAGCDDAPPIPYAMPEEDTDEATREKAVASITHGATEWRAA